MITSKQRSSLRAMANTMDPILQVGKDGVNGNIINNAAQALEARELVKFSVLETSPVTAREAAAAIMEAIPGTEPVQVIGRRFVLYKRNEKEPKIEL